MSNATEQTTAATKADALTKGGNNAEHIIKANADTLATCGNATIAGFHDLAVAYQELATKNAEKLTNAIQALAAVKSPAEFFELQQTLIKEGVDAAVKDGRRIADLTTAVFTAAFEPLKKQAESLHTVVRN
jgi:phasin family protein